MLECWGDYTQIICTEFGLKSVAHGEKQEVPEVFHGFGCYRVEVNRVIFPHTSLHMQFSHAMISRHENPPHR